MGNQLSQSSQWLWRTMRVGLSWSQVLRAEIKRSPLQWSWEAYDQGGPFSRNTYCCKILCLSHIYKHPFPRELCQVRLVSYCSQKLWDEGWRGWCLFLLLTLLLVRREARLIHDTEILLSSRLILLKPTAFIFRAVNCWQHRIKRLNFLY